MSPTQNQWYETPYIYAKNYFQNYTSLTVPTGPTGEIFQDVITSDGDSDFFARRSLGAFNFQDNAGNYFLTGGAPVGVSPAVYGLVGAFRSFAGADFALAPEKLFELGANIPIQIFRSNGLLGAVAPSQNPFILMTFPGVTSAFVGYTPI